MGCSPGQTHKESFPASMRGAFDTGPESARASFSNEYVSIVEHEIPSGEEIRIREYGTHLYALNDQTLKITDFKGAVALRSFNEGSAHSLGYRPFLAQNVGSSNARFLTVRRSMRALPRCTEYEFLPGSANSASNGLRTLLDTNDFRVILIDLHPGLELPVSLPETWALYPLNSFALEVGTAPADLVEMAFDEGRSYWARCCPLVGRNLSYGNARFVLFEIKTM